MTMAKLFKHGGSQAVRLPKEYRFQGAEVEIEKRGDEVVLRHKSKRMTFGDVIRELHAKFPELTGWPDRDQPMDQPKRDLGW